MKSAIIKGKRIYLRPLEQEDLQNGWHEWINDHKATGGLAGVFPVTMSDLEEYYKSNTPPGSVMFAICDNENDAYIGNCRLGNINWVDRNCTYGRLIGNPDYRGKGLGLEVLELMFRYGFHTLGMERIWSGAVSSNHISIKNNEKFGMKIEGVQKRTTYRNGVFYDSVMLAMLRDEFDELYGPTPNVFEEMKRERK
jgi:diamine N-acetyltransferase